MSARTWLSYLGSPTAAEAADEVTRLVKRLDEAYDAVSYVLTVVSGGPAPDVEEDLRVSRLALEEGMQTLHVAAQVLRSIDPTAA